MARANKAAKAVAAVAGSGVTPLVRQGERVFPTERRDGSKVGKAFGLLLTGWFNGVFDRLACGQAVVADSEGNTLPVYSDDAIAKALVAEYPARGYSLATTGGKQADNAYKAVSSYRGYYNSQQHGLGAPGYAVPKPATVRKARPAAVPAVPAAKAVATTPAKPASK